MGDRDLDARHGFRKLFWRLPLILLPQVVTNLFKTEAWRLAFPRRRPGFGLLFPVRLAGEAVNETTPTATMGGDALKAYLLVRAGSDVPIEEGFVSVVVAKTTLVASLAAFIGSAFVFAWAFGDVPSSMLVLLALLSLYMAASTAGFAGAQRRGCSGWAAALAWIGLGERVAVGAERLDAGLSWYYRERRAQAAAVLGLSFVGWATGALETWLMLYLLDSPVSLLTALIIEAGATGVRAVGFLIPGSIGVLEGGLVGIFSMLGLGSGTGLASASPGGSGRGSGSSRATSVSRSCMTALAGLGRGARDHRTAAGQPARARPHRLTGRARHHHWVPFTFHR